MLGGLGLMVAIAIGVAVWLGASRRAPERLDPAIIASLASAGITVSAPSTTGVPITRDEAVAVAIKGFPDSGPVSAAVLARVVVRPNAAYNCTCWVVSWLLGTGVPPQGGPSGGKASASQFQSWMRYHVTFVDAQSGKFEFAQESYYPLLSPTVT